MRELPVSQKGVEMAAREIAVLGDDVVDFEEQKLWQIQKEELEKELYHVSVNVLLSICATLLRSVFRGSLSAVFLCMIQGTG